VQIITGEEEGLFGWIAVNYLMDGFTGPDQNRTTYGFLDMGGASTQIAFEPSNSDTKNLIDVRLRLLNGEEIKHKVFVTTWLGYGTNQARERYVGKVISEFEASRGIGDSDIVLDPCLPKDLQLTESPVLIQSSTSHLSQPHHLKGTGSFEQCMQQTASLLNKTAPCPDTPCLMNGIHVPRIDFSVSHFIGVSEYWYSSDHVFGLGGAYDFVQYERAASNFCSRDWAGIMEEHEESKAPRRPGDDGQVLKDGNLVAGGWDPKVERSRLEMQCFKAAWVANVLHEGIGMPRIVDPGGNVTISGGDKVEEEAAKKGLGRPTFQSLDTVRGIAITWTLGKMVLEASKEVPLLSGTDRPLTDPIDDIPIDSPIRPIRPPMLSLEAIEDRISPHLPIVLSRTSLGFSPVIFLLLMSVCLISLVACPVRRQIRGLCLRSVRHTTRRDSLEEGTLNGNGHSLPSSPAPPTKNWLHTLRRAFSFTPTPRHPVSLSVLTSNHSNIRRMGLTNLARPSPTRSYTLPNGFDASTSSAQYSPRPSMSRSPSPSPGFRDDTLTSNAINTNNSSSTVSMVNPLISSRSRNTSLMNLSIIVPRQISRTSSYQNSVNLQEE
jgi:hypothetical protein